MMADRAPVWDAIVVGAGIAGAAAALGLKRALGATGRVLLCDPALGATGGSATSLRAVAIAPDVRRDLETGGVWSGLAARAQPIITMVITDARPGLLPNPAFLTFGGPEAGPEPLAHMVLADDLRRGLLSACAVAAVTFEPDAGVGLVRAGWVAALAGRNGRHQARLVVAADGVGSRLRAAARIQVTDRPYPQGAVVATLGHAEEHGGVARQHFFPAGPIAMLPMRAPDGSGRRTSLVWTDTLAEADRLAGLSPPLFVAALQARVGLALGEMTLEDRPRAVPLRLRIARRLTAERLALVGDAARVIHPLAGQGLNLGLRDAAALARHVAAAAELGLDPGGVGVLAAYERERRPETELMAAGTDLLDRLFSSDNLALRSVRDLGLGAVDRMPALKRRFVRQASGASRG